MARTVATILGAGFLLVGIVGWVAPHFLGMHLTATHNWIHLITGAVSLWFGLKASLSAARGFCIVFGLVYLGLGVIGFLVGDGPQRLLTLIPDAFIVGTPDHVVHIVLGAVYLIGGLATRTSPAAPDRPV